VSAEAGSGPALRLCRRCQRMLPVAYFGRIIRRDRQWLVGSCRACQRASRGPSRPRDKSKNLEAVRRYKQRHPEKYRASVTLRCAIKARRLVRPTVCEACGGMSKRIEAHHEDYSKPLDVQWLCTPCHGKTRRVFL
jgi:hypothetical protein